MSKAKQIVDALLEDDEPKDAGTNPEGASADPDAGINPEQYLHQHADKLERDRAEGKLTPETALTAQHFYSRKHYRADGRTPCEVRRNGSTKTWVRQPGKFRIPVKYGMYEYFYITDEDAADWSVTPLPSKPKPEKVPKRKKPVVNPSSLMPPLA